MAKGAREHSSSSSGAHRADRQMDSGNRLEIDHHWRLPRLPHSSSSKAALCREGSDVNLPLQQQLSSSTSPQIVSSSSASSSTASTSSYSQQARYNDYEEIDERDNDGNRGRRRKNNKGRGIRKLCSRKMAKKRLPFLDWVPRTTAETVICDIIAGLSVGLTVIPHGFAFAGLAGIPIQYGLYSAFVGCFVYLFLGSVKEVTIGPTATQSLITSVFITNRGLPPQIAVTMCLMSGCAVLLGGLLNLGVAMNFVSVPITSAFTTAVAINIASTQIKAILGIKYRATGFINVMRKLVEEIHQANLWDAVLGISCIIFLSAARFIRPVFDPKPGDTPSQLTKKKVLTLMCNAANAVCVIVTAAIAYCLYIHDYHPFPITGDMPAGIPAFVVPAFGYNDTNGTYHGFAEVAGTIGEGLAVVPILAVLESISIAKAFAKGKAMDATQEMLAIGTSNILGSFFSSMPVTGTFSRTAINAVSGVRSPGGGIITGSVVLVSLAFLTPCFKFIPTATLGAVVICAVIFVVDIPTVIDIWRTKKSDLLPYTATFFGCLLLEMHWGIIFGLIAQVTLILLDFTNPEIIFRNVEVEKGVSALVAKPTSLLMYPGMERFRAKVLKKARSKDSAADPVSHVVIDGTNLTRVDFSLKRGMANLRGDLQRMGMELHFARLRPEAEKVFVGQPKDDDTVAMKAEIEDDGKGYKTLAFRSFSTTSTKDKALEFKTFGMDPKPLAGGV